MIIFLCILTAVTYLGTFIVADSTRPWWGVIPMAALAAVTMVAAFLMWLAERGRL